MTYCSSLVELPPEIGRLTKLTSLSIRDCSKLVALPREVGQLPRLQSASIMHCSGFMDLMALCNLTRLEVLTLAVPLRAVPPPSAKRKLVKLRLWDFVDGRSLTGLKDPIQNVLPKCCIDYGDDTDVESEIDV